MVIELAIVLFMIFVVGLATSFIVTARRKMHRQEVDRKKNQTAVDIDRLEKELDQMDQENREAL